MLCSFREGYNIITWCTCAPYCTKYPRLLRPPIDHNATNSKNNHKEKKIQRKKKKESSPNSQTRKTKEKAVAVAEVYTSRTIAGALLSLFSSGCGDDFCR